MKRKLVVITLCSLALGLVIVLPGARAQIPVDNTVALPAAPIFGFGLQIAGTYYSPAGSMSLHADGTLTAASATCCGGQSPENIQSEAIGNWVRTGGRQIELSGVVYVDHTEGGRAICLASQQLDFAPDFQSYTGLQVTACWYEDCADAPWFATNCVGGDIPDLLDPDCRAPDMCTLTDLGWIPGFEDGIPVSGARLPVEYPVCP
jgi:hypothetical protein